MYVFLKGFSSIGRHFIAVFVASPKNEPWHPINETTIKRKKQLLSGYFQFWTFWHFITYNPQVFILYYTCILYCRNVVFLGQSTLHTLHFTPHTPHPRLHSPHFTLYTLHFALYTPHFTLYAPHFTLHTSHLSFYTLHSTLHNRHFTLYTLHSPLNTPLSSHSTLGTPTPSTFHWLQCTGTVTGEKCKDLQTNSKICLTKVFYLTAFGFVGFLVFFYKLEWGFM